MAPFSKEDFEVCMNVKVTTLGRLLTVFRERLDEEQLHPQAADEVEKVWNSRHSTGVQSAADAVHVLIKTSTQLSRCC